MSEVSSARRDGIGVGVAVGVSGVAFGSAAVTAGLDVAQACVLSLFAFTGASQFALAGVVGGGGNLVAGTLGALLLGARNTFYGLRLADLLAVRGPRRWFAAHGVIDETTAVATAQRTPEGSRAGFYATFAGVYVFWNLTTLAGAAFTRQMADPSLLGLDAVGPATFLALLWPRFREPGTRQIAVLGAGIALLSTPFLPPGVPVLLSAVAVLAGFLRSGTRGPGRDLAEKESV
ncbi:AzlC family ABC transporter permease [Bailinhaonella thermotolerans]|uniref:Branched-chain amino acid ABC transporter permease n=1 Tax=Bailinhaonella thermotolerans TaxID=1070861 RepID=A0A3A4AZF1_9ACTN|nr:AzlC family ABC transporter permease [Bailinhaonella thermotolerans]RJL31223.1 branched-chain amino acid ABC transporter permease [Bailinhaonella thermotolerans]